MSLYDRDGEPIGLLEWVRRMEDLAYRHVGKTVVDDVEISTVWIGSPPAIFETVVFGGELNLTAERYPTLEAAEAGHERWVARVREAARVSG
ncbi:MAG TPA: hypothetical protein VK595_16980 [Vicinamibacterales bacterium]|nr:hypothetical protein [Vicinamibacterales bacterium]